MKLKYYLINKSVYNVHTAPVYYKVRNKKIYDFE